MPLLSVQISSALHKNLSRKAKEMGGLKMSDVVRLLLQEALEKPQSIPNQKLQQQLLHYNITNYYMLQAQLLNSFEEGEELNDEAHQKATQLLSTLLKKINSRKQETL